MLYFFENDTFFSKNAPKIPQIPKKYQKINQKFEKALNKFYEQNIITVDNYQNKNLTFDLIQPEIINGRSAKKPLKFRILTSQEHFQQKIEFFLSQIISVS